MALGYADAPGAINKHCKYLKTFKGTDMDPFDLHPDTHIIPESDMYRLVFHSQLPSAEKFQDWVTEEVLPSIRKHGFYGTDDFVEMAIADPDRTYAWIPGKPIDFLPSGTLHPGFYILPVIFRFHT